MTPNCPNWPKNDSKLPKWPKNYPKWPKNYHQLKKIAELYLQYLQLFSSLRLGSKSEPCARTNVKWASVHSHSNLGDSNSIGQRRCHFTLWFLRSFPFCATFYHCFTAVVLPRTAVWHIGITGTPYQGYRLQRDLQKHFNGICKDRKGRKNNVVEDL